MTREAEQLVLRLVPDFLFEPPEGEDPLLSVEVGEDTVLRRPTRT
jgi:hypothetical protein